MAEYGISATQLSGPQGAGANVISPVTPAAAVPMTKEGSFLTSPMAASIVDLFAKGMIQSKKDDAEERKRTAVKGYVQAEAKFNDSVASGQMSPSEASARSRSNFNQYAAGYSEYIDDFEKAGKALRGFTEKGEAEKKVENEAKRVEQDVAQAQQRGFTFLAGESVVARDATIKAAKTAIQAEHAQSEQYKVNAEKRAQGTYDAGVAAKEDKEFSFKMINDVAGTNLTAFQEFSKTLGDQVRSGKMAPEMAAATLNERFTNISGAIQSAARTSPELAAPYRTLFGEINEIGKKLIDPKSNLEDLQNQLTTQQTKMKLIAMNDPAIGPLIVANQLFPNNLVLQQRTESVRALAIMSSKAYGETGFIPQVLGDPSSEPGTLAILKEGYKQIASGRVSDKEIATTQASNSTNHILKQVGEVMDKSGATAQSLSGVASFLASPEYAGFAASGKIDPQAAGAAKKAFQRLYEPVIINGVQEKLNENLERTLPRGGVHNPNIVPRTKIGDAIDIKFSGSGVVFSMKDKPGLNDDERVSQKAALTSLESSQKGINQLIQVAAHLEKSQDYNKFWEANKHIWIPSVFPDPAKLKVGQTVKAKNGKMYKYLGGNFNDIDGSYMEVPSGESK